MKMQEIFEQVLERGAVKLPQYFSEAEVRNFGMECYDLETHMHKVPRFRDLIDETFGLMPSAYASIGFVEAPGVSKTYEYSMHQDSVGRFGVSFIMPLVGEKASFYYADVPQEYPHNLSESSVFEYGPGDVAVLRQELTVRSGGEYVDYKRVYHIGVAATSRQLMICDVIPVNPGNAVVCLDDNNLEEAYGN